MIDLEQSEGIQLTRSFSPKVTPTIRRSTSAPPSRRKQTTTPRKPRVPWIPNAPSSNASYNTLTKQYFKRRNQVISNCKPPVLNVIPPSGRKDSPLRRSSTLSSGSSSPHIVETFIGGKHHVMKINSPLSSPVASPGKKAGPSLR